MTREDSREGNEGEPHTSRLNIVDSWEIDDCPAPLADGEDETLFAYCSIALKANTTRLTWKWKCANGISNSITLLIRLISRPFMQSTIKSRLMLRQ